MQFPKPQLEFISTGRFLSSVTHKANEINRNQKQENRHSSHLGNIKEEHRIKRPTEVCNNIFGSTK
jgi:hypothetical protein